MSPAVNNNKSMKTGSSGGGGSSGRVTGGIEREDAVFGVYLGATNMCVSVCRNGRTEVLANANGERVTPAVIRYLHGEQVIGTAALQSYHRHPDVTILHALSHVYTNSHSMSSSSLYNETRQGFVLGATAQSESAGNRRSAEPVVYTVERVVTDLLTYLYDIAVRQVTDGGSRPSLPAVLTIPLHWHSNHHTLLHSAAQSAGFHVYQLLTWPLAAALAHQLDSEQLQGGQPLTICALRVGGHSASAACLAVNSNGLLSLPHPNQQQYEAVGGAQLTSILAEHVTERLKPRLATGARSLQRVWRAVEGAKCLLSRLASVNCVCEGAGSEDGADLSCSLTRGRWEALLSQQQQKESGSGESEDGSVSPLTVWCRMASKAVGAGKVSRVLLCGGSARVPLLRRLVLAELGPSVELIDLGGATNPEPDEVFAIGAAIQCAQFQSGGISSPTRRKMALLSRPICIRTIFESSTDTGNNNHNEISESDDEEWRTLIECGAPLPAVACYPVPLADTERLVHVEVGLGTPLSSAGVECVVRSAVRVVNGECAVIGVRISAEEGLTVKVATTSKPSGKQVVVLAPPVTESQAKQAVAV